MRKLFGVWLLVAAGCTMPAGPESIQTDPPRVWPGLEMPVPTPPVPLARIGVEFLPAADGAAELLDVSSLGMSPQPQIGSGHDDQRIAQIELELPHLLLNPVLAFPTFDDFPSCRVRVFPAKNYRCGPHR